MSLIIDFFYKKAGNSILFKTKRATLEKGGVEMIELSHSILKSKRITEFTAFVRTGVDTKSNLCKKKYEKTNHYSNS